MRYLAAIGILLLGTSTLLAEDRMVSAWLYLRDGAPVFWVDEPIVTAWTLPAEAAGPDLALVLDSRDFHQLERSAKVVIHYEKGMGDTLPNLLLTTLQERGFRFARLSQVPDGFTTTAYLPAGPRRRSFNNTRISVAKTPEGQLRVAASMYLSRCFGKAPFPDNPAPLSLLENCRLESTWELPVEDTSAHLAELTLFLEQAFTNMPITFHLAQEVDPAAWEALADKLKTEGFAFVELSKSRAPARGGYDAPHPTGWSRAWRGRGLARGGLLVGMGYSTGLDRATGFAYPTFGWSYDWLLVHLDAICPLPWGLVDFLAGGVGFIAGGDDLTLPLWEGLNGKNSSGVSELIALRGRVAFFDGAGHKLDAGLVADLWQVSSRVEAKDLGLTSFNLGPSLGYGYNSKHYGLNLTLDLGNGFNQLSAWNPFLGTEVFNRLALGRNAGLYLRLKLRFQRFDYSNYQPKGPDADPSLYDFQAWEPMLGLDGGLFFSF